MLNQLHLSIECLNYQFPNVVLQMNQTIQWEIYTSSHKKPQIMPSKCWNGHRCYKQTPNEEVGISNILINITNHLSRSYSTFQTQWN